MDENRKREILVIAVMSLFPILMILPGLLIGGDINSWLIVIGSIIALAYGVWWWRTQKKPLLPIYMAIAFALFLIALAVIFGSV